jgi:hypothetical protein
MMKLFLVAGLAAAFCLILPAQTQPPPGPGSTPYPYPPGQIPGPLPQGSIPARGGKNKQKSSATQAIIAADGVTVSNDGKKLIVATQDGRWLTMSITPQTKFTRAGNDIASDKIIPRTTVHAEAAEDDEAFLSAVKVELVKDAPVETASAAPRSARTPDSDSSDEEMAQPTILKNPVDVPDRPILHHGKPAKSESASSSEDRKPAGNQPAPKSSEANGDMDFTIDSDSPQVKPNSPAEALIEKTKDWAMTFTNGLPNYICDQLTTRYLERSRSEGWEPLDVISAKVVYEDGKEEYRDITVGGKKTNKGMMELGGSTSTGEFASTLHSLFSSATNANFKLYESTSVSGSPASIYDFKVALRNSDWTIQIGGQMMRPAYSGSVWIDKASGEVRRIEMQADNVPHDFPLDSIQMAVDYEKIRLGTNEFLLPIHAENLACQRGSPICTKNAIDFRDYHKFTGESTIEFK